MTAMLLTGHGGPEKLDLRHDVPVPKPAAGEVLVEVSACGMNNTDIKVREGSYGAEDDPNAVSTWRARAGEESTLQFPRIQGADTVGTIVAVGDGVPESRIGERIMVDFCIYNRPEGDDSLRDIDYYGHGRDGGFAEYMTVESGNAIKVESEMDDAELATFSCAYQTGEHMLERAGLAAGETVLVTGAAGGVGSGIIQLARARGAIPYAITSKGKEDVLKDLGAEATIPRQDFQGPNGTDEQAFIDRVEQAMDGREIDVVADLVGGDMFNGLLRLLRPEGRYTTAGTIGGAVVPLDTRTLYLKHLQLHGSSQGRRQDFRRVVRYIEAGKIKSILHKTWKLSELREAQHDFVSKNYVGKMAVVPDSKWEQVGAKHGG
ncbi:Zn-dependent oxidoreductase [Rhodovibrio salinarum]|uniref:Zn-dependent oxidoreductase n=2 Tax=Rhodovibrio salinarum TaxID=1087 RepID=A0A934V0B7_9PROT|nr:Zn-dependent oxidoreductase [Rhodovibrio salinarum]